jgi:hypothetical protein
MVSLSWIISLLVCPVDDGGRGRERQNIWRLLLLFVVWEEEDGGPSYITTKSWYLVASFPTTSIIFVEYYDTTIVEGASEVDEIVPAKRLQRHRGIESNLSIVSIYGEEFDIYDPENLSLWALLTCLYYVTIKYQWLTHNGPLKKFNLSKSPPCLPPHHPPLIIPSTIAPRLVWPWVVVDQWIIRIIPKDGQIVNWHWWIIFGYW